MDVDNRHRHNQDVVNRPTDVGFEANQPPHVVARAQTVQALLRQHVFLSTFEAPHLPCPLSLHFVPSALDLMQGELEACLSLVEKTSGRAYATSSIGWNPRKKREEMLDGEMMYLLVRQRPTRMTGPSSMDDCILGFTSFMFTYDDPPHQDRQVVYLYEIHLDERLRGHGLGHHLLNVVETAARACRVNKTMLTVFTANKRAKGLYESLGYSKDEASPADRVTRNKVIKADYVIMSKSID